ncbi:hypothetical protein K438DRAFT_1765907 [Mycena galopus ATCC 62051]|nr:hypothetical protein K438DRAFT_1765907 [Mycena galopus ATCC 62051]
MKWVSSHLCQKDEIHGEHWSQADEKNESKSQKFELLNLGLRTVRKTERPSKNVSRTKYLENGRVRFARFRPSTRFRRVHYVSRWVTQRTPEWWLVKAWSKVLTNPFLSVFETGKEMLSTDGTETVSTVRRPVSDGNRGSAQDAHTLDTEAYTAQFVPGLSRVDAVPRGRILIATVLEGITREHGFMLYQRWYTWVSEYG